ncbi:MAG: MarR family transcriptional regulator [Oscillospiraceae bacterium]|nr:MarR family transcriptional regulator [Oscillospiraceae bacterium]
MDNRIEAEKNIIEIYDKMKLMSYRGIFDVIREREGSLSAMEAFSLEVIRMLGRPTVGEFADFLNISQSNATYKVNCLIKKGYIERENSSVDRREYHLVLSQKFYDYKRYMNSYENTVIERIGERFTDAELEALAGFLRTINHELMPECDGIVAEREDR